MKGKDALPERKSAEGQDSPEDRQHLADVIKKVGEGMQKLLASGLNRRAVVVLLAADTKVAKKDIERVLDGLENLARNYTQ